MFRNLDEVPFDVVRGSPAVIRVGGRYYIVGTAYGYLHNRDGGRLSYATRKAAVARLANYLGA
jgi:hypothetical protein